MLSRLHSIAKYKTKVLLVGIFVITGGILAGLYISNGKQVDCKELAKESSSLIQQKQYKKAYESLKASRDSCLKSSQNTKSLSRAEKVSLNGNAAVSAYQTGDKQLAKVYAQETIDQNQKMTPEERSQIPDQIRLIVTMQQIKYGFKIPDQVK